MGVVPVTGQQVAGLGCWLADCAPCLRGLPSCPAAAGTSSSFSPGCPRCWPPWAYRTCPPSACSAPCPGWCTAGGPAPAASAGTLLRMHCAAWQHGRLAHVCWLALLKAWSSVKDALACACPLSMQATAVVSVAAGGLADRLQAVHGWSAVRVRRAMQMSATLGTGLRWGSESWLGCSGACQGGVERVNSCSTAAWAGWHNWVAKAREAEQQEGIEFAAAPAPPAPLLQPAAASVAGSGAGACCGSGRAGGCGGLAGVHICGWALLKLGMGCIAMPPIRVACRSKACWSATPSPAQSPHGAPLAPCPLPPAGFHSYVQDVAPGSAGLVLAVTNSCGTLVGIGGNLVTGHLAASRWGYAGEAAAGGGWGGVRWVVGWWSVGCAAEPMIALA